MGIDGRPYLHFTAPAGWLNDPNGTVCHDGEYHLFYQHHPHSTLPGPMHWGHAVSADFLHWRHLPVALYPDGLGVCFSGSCVVDLGNSSGFGSPGSPPMVAAYTSHGAAGEERQSIAFSQDRGRSWSKYGCNPVVAEAGFKDFRDPRVFRYGPDGSWIMVVAAGDRVRLYRSPDLKRWSFASEFGPDTALAGSVWECPDLFELSLGAGTVWALTLSLSCGEGNRVVYYTGRFDGTAFRAEAGPFRADFGRDFYAPVTFCGAPGRAVWIGWMNNWNYAGDTPAGSWRGMMTMPRELSLALGESGARLRQWPVREYFALGRRTLRAAPVGGQATEMRLEPGDCTCFEIKGLPAKAEGAVTVDLFGCAEIRLDYGAARATFARSAEANACSHPFFSASPMEAPICASDPGFLICVDGSAAEVYIGGGAAVISALIYPLDRSRPVTLSTDRCRLERLEACAVG